MDDKASASGSRPDDGNGADRTHPTRKPRAARGSRDVISTGLRQLWADVENEPVPDEFLKMLDSIDAVRRDRPDETGSGNGNANT
ncbi:NepR family anti-sigma factor [Polymorphobacter sp.]|uniref:NepR family anti-sigma factor n=1 Tax=Polymorphobacter sp. TaxID=1909290 RepID=UPI003F715F52